MPATGISQNVKNSATTGAPLLRIGPHLQTTLRACSAWRASGPLTCAYGVQRRKISRRFKHTFWRAAGGACGAISMRWQFFAVGIRWEAFAPTTAYRPKEEAGRWLRAHDTCI